MFLYAFVVSKTFIGGSKQYYSRAATLALSDKKNDKFFAVQTAITVSSNKAAPKIM